MCYFKCGTGGCSNKMNINDKNTTCDPISQRVPNKIEEGDLRRWAIYFLYDVEQLLKETDGDFWLTPGGRLLKPRVSELKAILSDR